MTSTNIRRWRGSHAGRSGIALALATAAVVIASGCGASGGRRPAPTPVILDTDMGNDVDDAIALAMIHALESLGEARLIAVTITKDSSCAAPYVDLVNTFYGRPDIPIGMASDGKTPETPPAPAMTCTPAGEKNGDGSLVHPHDLLSGDQAPEATQVLRQALQAEKDGSVVVIQVGFSTNLAKLVQNDADRDLVTRKVRLLALTGGEFPSNTTPEYNIKNDIPAAQTLFSSWPTPVLVSGYEVGSGIKLPHTSIENDYSYVENHPIAEAFHLFKAWNDKTHAFEDFPYDRPMWDATATLYALRPESAYFSTSAVGTVSVDDAGIARFTAAAGGLHRYVVVDTAQSQATLESIIELASRRPDGM
jgi:inosine-uridine nucleoside N-ribohydrolase